MKIILILFYVVYHVCAQKQLDSKELGQFSTNEKQCIDQLHSDENILTQALKELYMPEDKSVLNEFMECTWKKDGLMEENGEIIFESYYYYVRGAYMDAVEYQELADGFAKDTISNCREQRGTTPGQTAVKLINCLLKRLYDAMV